MFGTLAPRRLLETFFIGFRNERESSERRMATQMPLVPNNITLDFNILIKQAHDCGNSFEHELPGNNYQIGQVLPIERPIEAISDLLNLIAVEISIER